uniref:KRAB domain-containing protein n=1 Tax=Panthera tigris altaica TaxID=74533 RepID=A0A8C9M113_PANTA
GRLTFRGVDIEPSHAEQELYRDVILLNCRNLASV